MSDKVKEVEEKLDEAIVKFRESVRRFYNQLQARFENIVPFLTESEITTLQEQYTLVLNRGKDDPIQHFFKMKQRVKKTPADQLPAFIKSIETILSRHVCALLFFFFFFSI